MNGIQNTGIPGISQTDTSPVQPRDQKSRAGAAPSATPSDQLDLSRAVASLLAQSTERVAELTAVVGAGTYSPDPSAVAGSIVQSAIKS